MEDLDDIISFGKDLIFFWKAVKSLGKLPSSSQDVSILAFPYSLRVAFQFSWKAEAIFFLSGKFYILILSPQHCEAGKYLLSSSAS